MWQFWRRKQKTPTTPVAPVSAPTAATPGAPSAVATVDAGGRQYLADVPYVLPKDDGEINRLDFQHYLLRVTLRANYAAPIGTPTSILDVGCGTGRWPLEMAIEFPGASVMGVDLVAPPVDQAAEHGPDRRPENYIFVQSNVLEGLPFADASFQLVHQRLLMGGIPRDRWPAVVTELARVTAPGGWLELVEAAPSPGGGPALRQLNAWMEQAMARRGIDVHINTRLADMLRGLGAINVNTVQLEIPMGRPAGRVGVMAATNYIALFTGLRGPILASGVAPATYDATLAQAQSELDQGVTSSPYTLAYGQRPR